MEEKKMLVIEWMLLVVEEKMLVVEEKMLEEKRDDAGGRREKVFKGVK